MPRRQPEVFTFDVERLGPVLGLMAELAPAAGWLTLQPAFDAEQAPPPRAGSGFFTARGPYIPVCSWVPGERTRQGVEYVAVGVQHGAGGKVAAMLAERNVAIPDVWEVLDDHPGRGLVLAVPPHAPHEEVLGWLLDAADVLCPVQLTGEWRAFVYRR